MKFIKKLFRFFYLVYKDKKKGKNKLPFGIIVYVGLPGQGKTLSMVEYLLRARHIYPGVKIYTNFDFKYQEGQITSWRDLLELHNEEGIIFALDEVHDIFDRKEWASMPKAIYQMFSQNRKLAKQFVCTSQTFPDVVIDIKRRTHYVIECKNLGKKDRWIFQKAFTTQDYKETETEFKPRHRAWRYSFIAEDHILDSYDSFAFIKRIAQEPEGDEEGAKSK